MGVESVQAPPPKKSHTHPPNRLHPPHRLLPPHTWYRGSIGCTATATSPSIVSGRVVATGSSRPGDNQG